MTLTDSSVKQAHPAVAQPSALADFRADAARWVVPGQIADPNSLSWKTIAGLFYRHLPLRAMAWFRLGSWCKQHRIPGLPGMIQRRIAKHYGLEIQVGAEIGGGLYVAHPYGTVIAPARIGRNCSIIAAVTIGMRNEWSFPTIGDQVFIGAGARVLGGIQIGSGAVIGANAVVIQNVPANTTAVGVPARLKSTGPLHGEERS
jgi:serine O-acetyltransferase